MKTLRRTATALIALAAGLITSHTAAQPLAARPHLQRPLATTRDGYSRLRALALTADKKKIETKHALLLKVAEKHRGALTVAASKAHFDSNAFLADARAAAHERDPQRRAQLANKLDAHRAALANVTKLSGIDIPAERSGLASGLGMSAVTPDPSLTISGSGARPPTLSADDPAAASFDLSRPFEILETNGAGALFAHDDGTIRLFPAMTAVGELQVSGSVGNVIRVPAAVRRVRATITARVDYTIRGGVFLGWAGADGIAYVRVLDGSVERCSAANGYVSVSIPGAGAVDLHRSYDIEVACTFERSSASATDYAVIAEFDAQVGAAGGAGIGFDLTATVHRIHVSEN